MNYEVVLGPRAIEKLRSAPEALRERIEKRLEELASDPKKIGRKTVSPPFVPIGHIYQFHEQHADRRHYFTVFFVYGDDEKSLNVWDIVIDPRFSDLGPS
jgi:hypothetical protein